MTYLTLLHSDHESGILGGFLHHLMEELGLGEAVAEFVTHMVVDCIEVFALLLAVMTAVFFIQSYIDFEKLQQKLVKLHSLWGYGLAMVLGVLSPFCSCSMIPIMMGLLSMGVPLSVCLCMLTTASLMNLTALTALYTATGPQFFGVYILCSLVLVAVSSAIFARIRFQNPAMDYSQAAEHHHHHHDDCCEEEHCHCHEEHNGHSKTMAVSRRFRLSFKNAWGVFRSAWFYIVLGVGLSAAITCFLPMDVIAGFVTENSAFSVTLVILAGLPVHSDLFSILPVILLLKDVSAAIAVTFTLSVMVISIPGIVLLTRVLKPKVIAAYSGLLVFLTLAIGYVLILL